MRPGTPGFVGQRLREAREVRLMPAVSLAEVLGVSPQAVSQYENDRSSPGPDVLRRISDALGFPEHFFLMAARTTEGTVFYRSLTSATRGARSRAEWRLAWVADIVHHLQGEVEFPHITLPDLPARFDPLLLSDDDIEQFATEARDHWRMRDDPVGNLVGLLERNGAVVARDHIGADALDSLSLWPREGRPLVFIGTDKGTAVRWRFDAAHELGHLLLHRHVDRRQTARPADHKLIEHQAHRFASAFLLPMAAFGEDLFATSLDAMRALKPKWQVSIAAMIMRARTGRLLSEEAERRLWINYNRRGWRRHEPLDDVLHAERPTLLSHAFDLITKHRGSPPLDVPRTLGLANRDVEALSGLPEGYFAGVKPVVQLRLVRDA